LNHVFAQAVHDPGKSHPIALAFARELGGLACFSGEKANACLNRDFDQSVAPWLATREELYGLTRLSDHGLWIRRRFDPD
jgi:hypothetical protein